MCLSGELRVWFAFLVGRVIDGHGYHEEVETGKELPHTLNIIFPAVLSMISGDETPTAIAGLRNPCSAAVNVDDEAGKDPEYLDLSETQQHSLHQTLHQAYAAAPAESGAIDLAANALPRAPVPDAFRHRAKRLGMSPSEWFDVSQRPLSYIENLLKNEERPDNPGASSSTA